MKKKLIITSVVVVVVLLAGYGVVRYGINFAFDKYFLETALSTMADDDETPEDAAAEETEPETTQPEQQETQPETSSESHTAVQAKTKLSNTEIISRVLKSSELTHKMASMVSYEDKRRVISIVMSNFTANELTEIAKNVSKGLTSEYKSRMIAEAQGRLTGGQWNECLNIAYKYIEQIRPYVE